MTTTWLLPDQKTAEKLDLTPSIHVFSSFDTTQPWAFPVDLYGRLCEAITVLSDQIATLFVESDLYLNDYTKPTRQAVIRPFLGQVNYVLVDRMVRLLRLVDHWSPAELIVPDVPAFNVPRTKDMLGAMARDSWVFNQAIINEFGLFSVQDSGLDFEELSRQFDFNHWTFYTGFDASQIPSKSNRSLLKASVELAYKWKDDIKIRQKLWRQRFRPDSRILATGIVYNNKCFRQQGFNQRGGLLDFFQLLDIDRELESFSVDWSLREAYSALDSAISEQVIRQIKPLVSEKYIQQVANQYPKLVRRLLPVSCLEAADKLLKKSIKRIKGYQPKAFMSSYPSAGEYYVYTSAAAREQGFTIYGIQHSGRGGYLSNDPIIAEDNIGGADYYVTSGWSHPESHLPVWKKSALPMSSPAYTVQKALFKKNTVTDKIVLVPLGEIFEYPVIYDGTYYVDTRVAWKTFMEKMMDTLIQAGTTIWLRPYCWASAELLKSVIEEWEEKFGSSLLFQRDFRKGKARELFAQVFATAWDVPGGGFVESLYFGTPSFSIASEALMRFQPQSQPVIDGLKSAGLLGSDPVEMANHILSAYQNPTWWEEPKRQKALQAFFDQFVRTNDDWDQEWRSLLETIKRGDPIEVKGGM